MAKPTTIPWNALGTESRERWTPIRGLEGMAEELSPDPFTSEHARLTRFLPGAEFQTDEGRAVLQTSFPNRVMRGNRADAACRHKHMDPNTHPEV